MSEIKRVCIESPYAASETYTVQEHVHYAQRCMKDSLDMGEAPYLGHLLYTQVYDDAEPEERAVGIKAHLAWMGVADYVVFYVDAGVSRGMHEGFKRALELEKKTFLRTLHTRASAPLGFDIEAFLRDAADQLCRAQDVDLQHFRFVFEDGERFVMFR